MLLRRTKTQMFCYRKMKNFDCCYQNDIFTNFLCKAYIQDLSRLKPKNVLRKICIDI